MANHSFNLVTEPWVPVLADGKHESYSLETLFDQPTSIRQLDIADPLERVSIMRLLLGTSGRILVPGGGKTHHGSRA